MKKILFGALFLLFSGTAFVSAQVTIGTNDNPHEGAVLDLRSTNQGLLLPNVFINDAGFFQLDGDEAVAVSMMIYNTNPDIINGQGKGIYVWNGENWIAVYGSGIPGTVKVGSYTWASHNLSGSGARAGVFVANIYDSGDLYQFNRSTGWASSGTITGWNSTGDTASPWWVIGNDPCPAGFRVPTSAQLDNLISHPNVWVTAAEASAAGVGAPVAGLIIGPGANSTQFKPSSHLFLPVHGTISVAGSFTATDATIFYWTSTMQGTGGIRFAAHSVGSNGFGAINPAYGVSIRCVAI